MSFSNQSTVAHPAVLLNARSIKNKLCDLHQLIYDSKLEFVFITESWLNDDVTDSMLDPNDQFNVFRRDRIGRNGGGVCALISKSFKCSVNDQLIPNNPKSCEYICIDTQLNATKYRFIVVYSPPHSCYKNRVELINHTHSLLQLIEQLSNNNFITVILGDFNYPKIDWPKLDCVNDGIHDLVFNHLSHLGFKQFVSEPTRLNHSSTGNILDLIFSNDHFAINIGDYSPPLGSSDHCVVNFDVYSNSVQNISNINVNINEQATHLTIFDWSAADFDAINNCLFEIDWNLVFGYNFDADSIWNAFKCTIWPIISMFVPRKAIPHYQKYRPRMYPKHIRKLLTRLGLGRRATGRFPVGRWPSKNIISTRNSTESGLMEEGPRRRS